MKDKKILWWAITVGVLLINIILIWWYFFFDKRKQEGPPNATENINKNLLLSLYEKGNYLSVVEHREENQEVERGEIVPVVISLMKLWYADEAWKIVQKKNIQAPTFKKLYKLLLLWHRKDRKGVIIFSKTLTDKDPIIRSLYLQQRALAFKELGNWDIAVTLAKDSVKMDSFAPVGLLIEGIDLQSGKFRKESYSFFERLEKLGHKETDEYLFYRGKAERYTKHPEDMEKHLTKVVDNPLYAYEALGILWYYFSSKIDKEYDKALFYFKKRVELFPDKRRAYRWEGRMQIELTQWEDAEVSLEKAIDKWGNVVDVLSDKLVVLFYLGKMKEFDSILLQIEQKLKNNVYHYNVVIPRLWSIWEYWLAWKYSDKALNDVITITPHLHNLISKTIIYNLINTYQNNQSRNIRHERLINQSGWKLEERDLFASLWFSLQNDAISALRALQQLDSKVTEADVHTIRILHHILAKEPKQGLEVLVENVWSFDEKDLLRLKRKIVSLWSTEQEKQKMLKFKDELLDLQPSLDENKMDISFDKQFDKWLRYMKKYYE